ncbi:hypothetical protein FCH28_29675 [Streptomyces piniterrae]|uniref:Uncharacterized protein n=1 Tax=Streptomyces piniterrae TaxID=2571125 RepID=A0A4U0MU44_9ACTN|nr:hypothetical protein FCH28_29675 [Streptomyces piniterrae]
MRLDGRGRRTPVFRRHPAFATGRPAKPRTVFSGSPHGPDAATRRRPGRPGRARRGAPLPPQKGTSSPASRSRCSALPMHWATEAPSALSPPANGPPPAANVQAGRPSRMRSASTRIMAPTPCSPSHSRMSNVTSSTPLSGSSLGHRRRASVTGHHPTQSPVGPTRLPIHPN